MKKFLYFFLFTSILLSCKSDQKKENQPSSDQAAIVDQMFDDLESIPNDVMQELVNKGTYIDYIFYNLPFSISQDDKPSIHANLNLISTKKMGGIPTHCKPIGREFFHIGGNIALEADVYFNGDCMGYVFLQDKKPAYANQISPEGIKFYTNLINQAKQIHQQAGNGG
ncbi:MAG: hypothetical protein AAGA77_06025 [Bacteroidota bacterium]